MVALWQALKQNRAILIAGGAIVALAAGLGGAMLLSRGHGDDPKTAPPASQAGLIVETRADAEQKLDTSAKLRCFVAGQLVGELTLAECANRNGVATGALDVGIDASGNLAAADQGGAEITPLPPQEVVVATPPPSSRPTAKPAASSPSGLCWRYAAGEWRKMAAELTLNACVQTLFAGHCERPGGATYGRWMSQTLRLVPGRVEVSGDNRSFHTLADQTEGCAVSGVE